MEDVLQLLRLILDTFLPLYCELAQEPPYNMNLKWHSLVHVHLDRLH